MRVALVHYHLRRGGVTSVVHHQAKALSEAGDEVLIITGEANPDRHGIAQAVVGELQYDRLGDEDRESVLWRAEILARKIYAAMEDHWGAAADIVHVHNPLIQKNAALIPALNILNKRGQKLLLQNHDLAEDFRPDMYVGNADYPADCHYGVINSRDFSFLHRAGLKAEGLHLIPNEVVTRHAQDGLPRTRYLYPVRAIRRKNIGEALLLSLFIPEGCTVALTLPPTTERDEKVYRFWQEFAVEHKLPVEFALGLDSGLPELLGTSLCIISSSVKEGFGFSFLEPWTAGRAVIGRRIEYVCRDFEENGIRFDALYSKLNIPMVYFSPPVLRKKMEYAMTATYKAFGLAVPSYILKMMTDNLFSHETVDFGRLDEEMQASIIKTMVSNESALQDIAEINPFLLGLRQWKPDEELIEANRERIQDVYGKKKILSILRNTYDSVLRNPVTQKISKPILLELFLDPLKLSLVGVGHDS